MPYYGDGLPYYYGGAFANHSSLMTGAPRAFHTPLSRFSPHLSTISESPLSTLRRYSPVSVPTRPRRVIDTADIDVSTPRTIHSQDGNRRNRLRRDRPTIKIRSQALKDNPALREHNERHEKSVGELLVEKFLIKDKKLEEAEKGLHLIHQVSLDRGEDDEELQQMKNKITRRFTRRRSSADIQLDPEQLEREVAYAQVQAKVLDTLVAEEQAEIENEVRRGTLIKKSNTGGPRTVPGFFRNVDGDSASQGEEEAAAQKMRKTLKKLKKKKKTTEKPSPPDDEDKSRVRRSSTSSDVSVELQTDEKSDKETRKHKKPQMFKVEASNSVGDFSTIWVNSGDAGNVIVEQFRESVRIPVPRKMGIRKIGRESVDEESETEVVLPVKRPYVKDTSRNSVHFTVRTPPEKLKDPLKELRPTENGVEPKQEKEPFRNENILEKKEDIVPSKSEKEDTKKSFTPKSPDATALKKEKTQKGFESPKLKNTDPLKKEVPESPKSPTTPTLKKEEKKGFVIPKLKNTDLPKEVPESPKSPLSPTLKKESSKSPVISKFNKTGPLEKKAPESPKSPDAPTSKKEPSTTGKPGEEVSKVVEENTVLGVDPLANENSASAALPSAADRLPKASKINTDENNAVEAPKRSLREAEYLAKPTKIERDEDVVYPLPGKKVDKAVTLTSVSTSNASGAPINSDQLKPSNREDRLENTVIDDATTKLVTKTTLLDGTKSEAQKKNSGSAEKKALVEDVKGSKAKQSSLEKLQKTGDEESSKIPVKVTSKKEEDSWKRIKTESNKKSILKDSLQNTSKTEAQAKESKIPWRNKVTKAAPGDSAPLNRSVSVDVQPSVHAEDSKSLKQSTSVDESLINKMPTDKQHLLKSYESLNGESGTLSKSTSSESIDFWSEIKGPDSPKVAKVVNREFSFAGSKNAEPRQAVEDPIGKQLDKKKETAPKINVAAPLHGLSNIPVIEEERKAEEESSKLNVEQRIPSCEASPIATEKPEPEKDTGTPKKGLKKKNLSLAINSAPKETAKTPLNREDSTASTISAKSVTSTPDTSVPVSEVSTPVSEIPVPIINVVDTPTPTATPTRAGSQILEDEDEPKTPTNEWQDDDLPKISKWNNHNDLSNVDQADVTPVPSKDASVACSPENSPDSSKKKKIVRKKKSSTTKSSTKKSSTKKETPKESKRSKKASSKTQDNLKPSEPVAKTSPKNSPAARPIDLIRMFYTTPMALLTATPRDLSKVRRAKIKRKKHHSRTPSMSSDSTGSTTSTATTESSGSTCAELDDDPEHKRMNSTRSNDSGFDGSPRISTPSQSSDTQRNSDSSDHFPSGRITPPATNLPRFKKYAVTDFNFLKVLGKGSFGKVLLAELRGTECVYAVKCLKKDVVLEDDDVECTLIERKVLTLATRHPYLCHLFCTFQTDSHLFFVMEYLNGGDLMFHIQKSGRFAESRARFYAAEIWSGLNFLHKKGIVYRDLKLDNVLLDFEGHIRIADFGMCKLQIFLDRTADTFCGTPDYMAPEIIKGLKYNQAVDWWSYGVLLYEMLTGQSPFSGCDEDELFWSICNERPFIPRYLSQEAADILICLLEKDSGKRLPGHEIALHSFFQSLPWDRLERRQLEPPFRPALDHTLDTKYFDTAFTAERPRLTPVPEQILTSMDQGVFRGFSYTNPNATD
ncbi:uncharacterized protein LOC100875557 [Megachile rotundata]|uniref:uncharacterized protein LOC100875557 n=1 Tax=Megachile rotundata TaxID=143995 RepID=UPI003FD039BE